MSPLAPPFWNRLLHEFHCPECGGRLAHRSRPHGLFEKYVLSLLMQPVRCDHCCHRTYAFKSVPAQERLRPAWQQPRSQPASESKAAGRVA